MCTSQSLLSRTLRGALSCVCVQCLAYVRARPAKRSHVCPVKPHTHNRYKTVTAETMHRRTRIRAGVWLPRGRRSAGRGGRRSAGRYFPGYPQRPRFTPGGMGTEGVGAPSLGFFNSTRPKIFSTCSPPKLFSQKHQRGPKPPDAPSRCRKHGIELVLATNYPSPVLGVPQGTVVLVDALLTAFPIRHRLRGMVNLAHAVPSE